MCNAQIIIDVLVWCVLEFVPLDNAPQVLCYYRLERTLFLRTILTSRPPNIAHITLLHNRRALSLSQVREYAVYPDTSLELECAHTYPEHRDANQGGSSGGRTGLLVASMAALPTIGIAAYAYQTKRQVSKHDSLPSVLHLAANSISPRNHL